MEKEMKGNVPSSATPTAGNLLSSPILPGDKQQAIIRDSIIKHGTIQDPSHISTATGRPAPQRRAASGHGILGVQGPRAAPFWLSDPEEILREAAKLRRSRSPTKRDSKSITIPKLDMAAEAVGTTHIPEARTSSPLSSVPTTPDFDGESTQTGDGKVQFDGSLDRQINSVATCSSHAPSPANIIPAATATSPTESRIFRQSRDGSRLRTTSNPPLNTDCVIAFAEGQNEQGNGVLRQVRGERQGVFREEYVVFAARSFIPGG